MEGKLMAETTLQQLGGAGRIMAMTGAYNFTYDRNGTLTFEFPDCELADRVSIEVHWTDTYIVRFYKFDEENLALSEVATFRDIFCDTLKSTFEEFTGLFLSLN